jgi:thiamine-phosphate pyrophosphorylase
MLDGPSLRILDANANRAREALRVLEDYARFALNHDELSSRLKSVRHELTTVLKDDLPDAILHRDTPGDVGTNHKTPGERHRDDLSGVVTAAGKRLGEALRVIEEVLKTAADATRAARAESIRYRFYDLEQTIARTLRPPSRFRDVRLYVLITESLCRAAWLETAEQAIFGGADCVQLREKELESGELLRRAEQLVSLCRKHDVLCIINDRPDIALLSGADGVHVGQTDLPAAMVRRIIGYRLILGVSTHRIDQARQAVLDGADYVGVGPIFRSSTKTRDFIAGPDYARQVSQTIPIPAVAIAGITEENVDEVLSTGVRAVAVTAAVASTPDPRAAAERLKRKLSQFKQVEPAAGAANR